MVGTEILQLFMMQAQRRQQQFEILHLISTSASFPSLPYQEVIHVSVNCVPSKGGPYQRYWQWRCHSWSSSCEVPARTTSLKAKCRWRQQQWGVRGPAQGWDTHTELMSKALGFSGALKCIPCLLPFFFVAVLWKSSLHDLAPYRRSTQRSLNKWLQGRYVKGLKNR